LSSWPSVTSPTRPARVRVAGPKSMVSIVGT
jgi:hypothetical protein